MNHISMHSIYSFKEDYCRRCVMNSYTFNGFTSFIDLLNSDFFNSDKMSWDSWYYMNCDEDDKVYISTQQMMMW